MAWSPDPELHQMFLEELDQRSGRLADAARALADGNTASVDVSAMRREGHTIKGTARVMGYETLGLVALMIEEIWDGIGAETIEPSPDLGEALAALCIELELAGREDAQHGTTALRDAAARVHDVAPSVSAPDISPPERIPEEEEPARREQPPQPAESKSSRSKPEAPSAWADDEGELIEDVEVLPASQIVPTTLPDDIPTTPRSDSASRREAGSRSDTLPVSTGPHHSQPASRREPLELPVEYGGVIEAIESWAREGTVIVNAGRLYRLINRIAATRAEAAELADKIGPRAAGSPGLEELVQGVVGSTDALQADVLGLASLPLSTLTSTLSQLVNYLSKKLGKNVTLEIEGDQGVVIDRQVLEAISEPVRQLIVNALYHGLEVPSRRKDQRKPNVGSVTVDVALEGNMLELVVADDGAGVDWDVVHEAAVGLGLIEHDAPRDPDHLTPLLFEPGFTTGAIEGGRGDGLARLAAVVEGLHGRVHFETWPGDGTRVTLRVPAWQALHRVLIVWAGGMRWAISEAAVERTMSFAEAGVDLLEGVMQMDWGGSIVPLLAFATAAGVDPGGDEAVVVVLSHRVGTAAFAVDAVEGRFEVAVTELSQLAEGPEHLAGVALLGGGEVALVVDAGRLIDGTRVVPGASRSVARVLVVDGADDGRAVLSGSLSSSGFSTSVAGTVAEALDILGDLVIDAVVVDDSLPSASAIALVEEVRRRDRDLPIAMVSNGASEEDRIRAKKAGVDRFFDRAEFRDGALVNALWELLEA